MAKNLPDFFVYVSTWHQVSVHARRLQPLENVLNHGIYWANLFGFDGRIHINMRNHAYHRFDAG